MDRGSTDDYYALLGIDESANSSQLRRAWRRLALRWHPDHAGAEAKPTFQKLLAAYTVLSDSAARAEYDRRRGPVKPPSAAGPRRRAPSVMLRRLSGQLSTLLACGVVRRAQDDVLELLLTESEMAQGGMVTIAMWVPVRCPACAANPQQDCARCANHRASDQLFSAWLAVPPDVAEGAVLQPSALLPGMVRPVSFRVRRDDGR